MEPKSTLIMSEMFTLVVSSGGIFSVALNKSAAAFHSFRVKLHSKKLREYKIILIVSRECNNRDKYFKKKFYLHIKVRQLSSVGEADDVSRTASKLLCITLIYLLSPPRKYSLFGTSRCTLSVLDGG